MEHRIYRVKVEFSGTIEAASEDDAKGKVLEFLKNHPEELTFYVYFETSWHDLEAKEGK